MAVNVINVVFPDGKKRELQKSRLELVLLEIFISSMKKYDIDLDKLVEQLLHKLNIRFGDKKVPEVSEVQGLLNSLLSDFGFSDEELSQFNEQFEERINNLENDEATAINLTSNAIKVLRARYLLKNKEGKVVETPHQMFKRVAHFIASAEKKYDKNADIDAVAKKFYNLMSSLDFLPNSPTLMNAGTDIGQLSACFVLPVEDSIEGIFDTVKHTAFIHKSGGGTGFSFSRLRPKNDVVKTTGGIASGPVSFMRIFDVATDVIKQGGRRRGANMGILRVDHPDIIEFITCKSDGKTLQNFNISVAATDEFMKALESGGKINLVNPRNKQVVDSLDATKVFDLIAENAWKTGDPGMIFIDLINKYNPTPALGEIESTNPCVVGDTLVVTDKGVIRAKDLKVGMKVWNGHGWNVIEEVIDNGIKPVYRVRLKSGLEVRVTAEHKFLTESGWKEVKNLKPHDKVFVPLNYSEVNLDNEKDVPFIKTLGTGSAKKDYEYQEITEIEANGEDRVFDIKAPPEYTWITNGILSMDCGEQPLLPYESCNLGSINLRHMVKGDWVNGNAEIDWEKLKVTVWDAIHFLDNVIDVNQYPLEIIGEKTRETRKIGLGVMGFADMLIMLGVPYNSPEAEQVAYMVMEFINYQSKLASIELAKSRGSFPAYQESIYPEGKLPMPDPDEFDYSKQIKNEKIKKLYDSRPKIDWKQIKEEIKKYGIRNADTTTIAPTGTISIIGGASSGIEPIFALAYERNVTVGKLIDIHDLFREVSIRYGFYSEALMEKVLSSGSIQELEEIPEHVRKIFVTAHDISPEWHIRIQAAFQRYVDNAVSKTINLPHSATVDDVKNAYLLAYKLGCKGITIYRDRSKNVQVLVKGVRSKDKSSSEGDTNVSNVQKKRDIRGEGAKEEKYGKPRPRPNITFGATIKMKTSCGNLYVTINEDEKGPLEVFARLGKSGGCLASYTEAIGRLVSLALRSGVDPNSIVRQLTGIRCPLPILFGKDKVLSCSDAIGQALKKYLEMRSSKSQAHNVTGPSMIISPVEHTTSVSQSEKKHNEKNTSDSRTLFFLSKDIVPLNPDTEILVNKTQKAEELGSEDAYNGMSPQCPECGAIMEFKEGCATCPVCGYSKCM